MKICNRSWQQIQTAQKGGSLDKPVVHEDDIEKYRDGDMALFNHYGIEGLKRMGYLGVIDRLERSGHVGKD